MVATAKIDLKAGQILDGMGQYMTYGQCENSDVVKEHNLLPIGLAEGCRIKRDISKDQVITNDDIDLPKEKICYKLRSEQNYDYTLSSL